MAELKLNLTKEQALYFLKEYPHQKGDLCEDWLTMYKEIGGLEADKAILIATVDTSNKQIERMNKTLQEAVEEIEGYRDEAVSDNQDDVPFWNGRQSGYMIVLDILRDKYFPELKEVKK